MIPTEEQEQMAFVQWLALKHIDHFRVPNETFTKSWNQKRKNKALGVSSGVPDLFVILPKPYNRLVAIEMKRIKGGVTSESQKIWLHKLNAARVEAVVCKGCDEAIEFINSKIGGNGDEKFSF